MQYIEAKIVKLLMYHFEDDDRRINHALNVLYEAKKIVENERLDIDFDILVAVSLLHDVGIKESEKLLGYNDGKTQELYGPPIAENLLKRINFSSSKIQIVKDIIGNHHSSSKYDYLELSVLKRADAIINSSIEN